MAIVSYYSFRAWIEGFYGLVNLDPTIPERIGLEVKQVQPLFRILSDRFRAGGHGVTITFIEFSLCVITVIKRFWYSMKGLILEWEYSVDPFNILDWRQAGIYSFFDFEPVLWGIYTGYRRMIPIKTFES